MMIKLRYVVIFIFLGCASLHAFSATVESTTIKKLMFDEGYGEIVHIQLNQRQGEPVDCHTNVAWEYVLDISNPLGEKMYSSLLAAYAAKSNVKFVGRGDCTASPHNNTESLRRIELK